MINRRFINNDRADKLFIGFLILFTISVLLIYQLTQSSPVPHEEVIHIVYMLGGNSYTRHLFHTHLKSLLSFSNSSLHLHVIADSENIEDVTVLLDTWHLPRCRYTFYDEKDYTDKISWVPAEHYSKQFGYLQLVIPYILGDVDKVIAMNVDLVFQFDVKELWDKFEELKEPMFLGMAPTTSPWYQRKHKKVWPAVKSPQGLGYNSGLIMMDLRKMRFIDWAQKWRNLTERYYAKIKFIPLADQDILNTWIFENPETFLALPCSYNFELGGNSRPELCPSPPKMLHFNTIDKILKPELSEYTALRKVFIDKDGDDLRRQRSPYQLISGYRILPNAYGRRNASKLCWGTTLVTTDLETFLENANLWTLPISVVLSGSDKEVGILSERLYSLKRDNLTVHSVFSSDIDKNSLRNVLIDNSNCDQLLISDVDFDFVGDLGNFLTSSMKMTKITKSKEKLI